MLAIARRRPAILSAGALGLVVLAAVAWFLVSPLFVRTSLIEAPMGAPIARGAFNEIDVVHKGRGNAVLSRGVDGRLVVALENFSVSNGKAEALFPGWLRQLLTTPVRGLERYHEMLRELTDNRDAIKVYVEVGREGSETSSGGREWSR